MKKSNAKQAKELDEKDYPRTFQLLKDLEELLNDKEEYTQW
jgi:hypothetical protein